MNDKSSVADIRQLVVDYAKQETVEPLSKLGNYLAFGILGSVFMSVGAVFLCFSLVRALQTETGTALTGSLSWVPYVAGSVFMLIIIAILISLPRKGKAK